jgi:hypothetical protein
VLNLPPISAKSQLLSSKDGDHKLPAPTDRHREDNNAFEGAKCAKAVVQERPGPPTLDTLSDCNMNMPGLVTKVLTPLLEL